MLTKSDINQLEKKGISVETVKAQLDKFVTGFPYLRLQGAATPGNGVIVLDDKAMEQSVEHWEKYIADGGEAMKMVPASGAASRMFKALFAFVDSESDRPEPDSDVAQVIENIDRFAFAPELDNALKSLHGLTAKELIAAGRYKDVVAAIVGQQGLDYGNLPKALLKFHSYPDGARTPLEEQLTEAAQTVASADGKVRIQFTVSPEHRGKFLEKLDAVLPEMEKRLGVR